MATRFMHFILSWEGVTSLDWPVDKIDSFLTGSLLPDAVDFREKKETHFIRSRLGLGYDNFLFAQKLTLFEPVLGMGWKTHLDLDELWQRTCFRPRMARAPLLLFRYGLKIGSKYYKEMSAFDVIYRDRFKTDTLHDVINCLNRLNRYIPPTESGIQATQWGKLLRKLQEDLVKTDTYDGWEFVGKNNFDLFCRLAKDKLQENLGLI